MWIKITTLNKGVNEEITANVTKSQYKTISNIAMYGCDETGQNVSREELRQQTMDALAKQVELLDECDDAAKAQIMQQKFDVLNRTLRTLWMV